MITTLIIDLDGPILDGKERHYACYRQILDENGYSAIPIDEYWRLKRERIDRRTLLSLSDAQAIYDLFLAQWLARIENTSLLSLDRLQLGAQRQLRHWQEQGIQLLLATMRHNAATLHAQLDELSLASLFDKVIVCEHRLGGAGKAQQVLAAAGELPHANCMWIGDTEADIEGARCLGVRAVALTCGLRTSEYLATQQPYRIYEYLADVEIDVDLI